MKKLLCSALLFTALLLVLQSCQREVDFNQQQGNPAVAGDFRAKIDGVQWVADSVAGASRMSGRIALAGVSIGTKRQVAITLEDRGVGTYILNDTAFSAAAYTDWLLPSAFSFTTNQGNPETDLTNKVVITSIDAANKRITGTFSFVTHRQADGLRRTFTEGSFNLKYETSLPPGSATDTFRVKIAGSSWTPQTVIGVKTPAIPPMAAQLAITASDAQGIKAVGFFLPTDIAAGSSYTLDWLGGVYIASYNPDNDPSHAQGAVSGTLTVLEHNTTTKRIRANFNFRGETILPPILATDLTEGYFSIKYQ